MWQWLSAPVFSKEWGLQGIGNQVMEPGNDHSNCAYV